MPKLKLPVHKKALVLLGQNYLFIPPLGGDRNPHRSLMRGVENCHLKNVYKIRFLQPKCNFSTELFYKYRIISILKIRA